MDMVKTITIDNPIRPVALRRSSVKVSREPSQHLASRTRINSAAAPDTNYRTNYEAHRGSQRSSNYNVDTDPQTQNTQTKHIKLVIANQKDTETSINNSISQQDLYLATLIDEYQSTLNRKDCGNSGCYRFKLLSYRLTQTLFDRMNVLKNDLQKTGRNDNAASHQSFDKHFLIDDESNNMDKDSLLYLVSEKEKRIQDLERLVEDQKTLRLQDASLVEEKAARIKEWVANKLKELENQNRQLRDQNRKQKETVESLSNKLATITPVSSPRRINVSSGSVQYIDQSSPIETLDVDKSLKTRKPHLKEPLSSISSSSEEENLKCVDKGLNITKFSTPQKTLVHSSESGRHESPIYDSVTLDQVNRRNENKVNIRLSHDQQDAEFNEEATAHPPPPPLHQSDKWELQLYNLADQTFSAILKQAEADGNGCSGSCNQLDRTDSRDLNSDTYTSRKSSTSLRNELISLAKPTFTTIDGEQVVDSLDSAESDVKSNHAESIHYSSSNDLSRQSSLQMCKLRKDSMDSSEMLEKSLTPSLFDSPIRSKSGSDRILRTQSIRRNPAPEKLYNVVVSDFIKRGYLLKPGALKNYNRWFVLKNFTLYSYKSESDEISKSTPTVVLKLEPSCHVHMASQTNDSSYPFKISCHDKTLQFIAESAQVRDEWVRILSVAINMSDIVPETLTKEHSSYEGIMSLTRQGHTKRCHAIIVGHIVFFLRSLTDPTPISYLSVKGAKIREVTDTYDDDFTQQQLEFFKDRNRLQDCSLAIYPKYSLTMDPIYVTLGGQQETDEWFYFMSIASGIEQYYGTPYEQTIAKLMINNSVVAKRDATSLSCGLKTSSGCCWWKEHSIILYSDRPITKPLTSLPNENLRTEALQLFKSLLLFTQVPLEPVAIDYHVSLLQNCLKRFLQHPELRNEFYAQMIKQCTYVRHRCNSSKLSRDCSDCPQQDQRLSVGSLSQSSNDCQFITDIHLLDSIINDREVKVETNLSTSQTKHGTRLRSELSVEELAPPSQSELLQVMQILAIAVSLSLPRGRMRWWLADYLGKFANPDTDIGKYALYTLKAIDRTIANGTRDSVPSRTEIMSILLRNPYDHSNPHSLPVSFCDGSYLVVGADGSTTVDEFICSIGKQLDIRHFSVSDFYLFTDDPSGSKDLHILEPQRKVLDIVGWWEQTFRQHNSGRYQNTKANKFICKKRLILRSEEGETQQERLLIAHQMNQEVASRKIKLGVPLTLELGALMAQMTYGDFDKSKEPNLIKCMLEKISTNFLPSQTDDHSNDSSPYSIIELVKRWEQLTGKKPQDCVRVYINCIRRMKLEEY